MRAAANPSSRDLRIRQCYQQLGLGSLIQINVNRKAELGPSAIELLAGSISHCTLSWVGYRSRHRMRQACDVKQKLKGRASTGEVSIIGVGLAKYVFQSFISYAVATSRTISSAGIAGHGGVVFRASVPNRSIRYVK